MTSAAAENDTDAAAVEVAAAAGVVVADSAIVHAVSTVVVCYYIYAHRFGPAANNLLLPQSVIAVRRHTGVV